jgi:flagellar basal-body rod protein FlgF
LKNIWVSISGQLAQQRKIETIANNVANANTSGFKRDQLVFKEHLTALDKGLEDIDIPDKEFRPEDFYRSQGAQNSFVKVDRSYTIHEQGQLTPTGNKFDLALSGKGFFEVQSPTGIRFTRKGIFNMDAEGKLVTSEGYPILAQSNNTKDTKSRYIKIPTESKIKNLSIINDGSVFINGERINQLSVVEMKDIHSLRKEGSSLFVNNAGEENLIREGTKTLVYQGFTEESNVNAIREMSELVRAHRHFENIQKAIQTYDAISGQAVNDIAKF